MNNPHHFTNRRLGGWMISCLLLCLAGSTLVSWPSLQADETPPEQDPITVFLPLIQAQAAGPISAPETQPTSSPRRWDPRLHLRGTVLNAVDPVLGQGYWRLVSARWFDEDEAGGRHHILIDVLDAEGRRLVDVPVRIYWGGGETIIRTGEKAGESYAADFGMFDVAPSYGAAPITGDAADDVWGMGLGSIEQPKYKIHTSYGLVWQWTTQAGAVTETPTPTVTATATVTPPSAEETPTPTITPTATQPSAEPVRQWDPRLDARGVILTPAQVAPGQGYWRLVRGRWYDEQESSGRHHIFLDLVDAGGGRVIGAPMRIYWNGGEAIVNTEAKPGEEYSASFGMNSVGPSYGAQPLDGQPADSVWGMGLGSIEAPNYAVQTSYGFVWQWSVKPPLPQETNNSGQSSTLTAAP